MVNAQEPRLRIETRNTKGSTENVPLLEEGKLDLALVAGEIASAALAKPGTQAAHRRRDVFLARHVHRARRQPVPLDRRPARASRWCSARRLPASRCSAAPCCAVLEVEVQPIILEKAADGPPMLLDGRAAALWGAGVGWPAFTALAKAGGRFIGPSADGDRSASSAKNPALQAVTLPAKSYPGPGRAAALGRLLELRARAADKLPDEAALPARARRAPRRRRRSPRASSRRARRRWPTPSPPRRGPTSSTRACGSICRRRGSLPRRR